MNGLLLLKTMGIKTKVTSRGVISSQTDGASTFNIALPMAATPKVSVTAVSGSATVTHGSTTLFMSGTHPDLTVTLPAIAAANVGSSTKILTEAASTSVLLSGSDPITGSLHTKTLAAALDPTTTCLMAVSGTNGFSWIVSDG